MKRNNSSWYIFNERKQIWEMNEKPQMVKKVCEFLINRFVKNNPKPPGQNIFESPAFF